MKTSLHEWVRTVGTVLTLAAATVMSGFAYSASQARQGMQVSAHDADIAALKVALAAKADATSLGELKDIVTKLAQAVLEQTVNGAVEREQLQQLKERLATLERKERP